MRSTIVGIALGVLVGALLAGVFIQLAPTLNPLNILALCVLEGGFLGYLIVKEVINHG